MLVIQIDPPAGPVSLDKTPSVFVLAYDADRFAWTVEDADAVLLRMPGPYRDCPDAWDAVMVKYCDMGWEYTGFPAVSAGAARALLADWWVNPFLPLAHPIGAIAPHAFEIAQAADASVAEG